MLCNENNLTTMKQRFIRKVLPKSIEIIFKIFIISNTISNREIHDHTVIDPNMVTATLTYVLAWLFAECEIAYGSLSFMRDVFCYNTKVQENCAYVYTHCLLVFIITKFLHSLSCMLRVTKILLKIPRECIVGCSLATGVIHVANEIKMYNTHITLPSFVLSVFFVLFFFYSKIMFFVSVVVIAISNHVVVACVQNSRLFFFEKLRCNSLCVLFPVQYFDLGGAKMRSFACSFFSALAIFFFNGIEIELDRESDADFYHTMSEQLGSNVVDNAVSVNAPSNGLHGSASSDEVNHSSGDPLDAVLRIRTAPVQSNIAQFKSCIVLHTNELYHGNRLSCINLLTFFLPFTVKKEGKQFHAIERVFVSILTLNMAILLLLFRLFIPKIIYISLSMFLGLYIIVMSLKEVHKFCTIEKITIVCLGVFNAVCNMFVLSVMSFSGLIYLVGYMRNSNNQCLTVEEEYSHVLYDYKRLDMSVKGEIVVIDLRRYSYIVSSERERIGNLVKRLRVKNIFVIKRKNLFIWLENVNFICELNEIEEYLV